MVAATDEGGPRLLGRYEYVGELGQGALGRVIEAVDRGQDGARCALKVLPATEAERIQWELSRLREIEHPAVAAVRELRRVQGTQPAPWSLSGGSFVLVQERAPGVTADVFAAQLREHPRRLAQGVLRVALGACEALAAMHGAGLVHGDVKPDNLMVAAGGERCMLVDLGLARPAGVRGAMAGTPRFAAPEVFAGVCSPGSDLYALGVTLHDMLTGDAADVGTAERDSARAPWRGTPLSALPAGVPPGFAAWLAELLEPRAELRPHDAAAAGARLAAVAEAAGLQVADDPARWAGGRLQASGSDRARRVRALPFVGHAALREELCAALRKGGLVRVGGPRAAGKTRLVREAIVDLQRSLAVQGQPTCGVLSSLKALEGVDGASVVHLARAEQFDELAVQRVLAVAEVGDRALSVVVEVAPGDPCDVQLAALAEADFERLLTAVASGGLPEAARAAARRASAGLAGRLCELAAQALEEGHDLAEAAAWQSWRPADSESLPLPSGAQRLAQLLSVAPGGLSAEQLGERLGDDVRARAALDALRERALLDEDRDGRLQLLQVVARRIRSQLTAAQRRALADSLVDQVQGPLASAYCAACRERYEEAERLWLQAARAHRHSHGAAAAASLLSDALAMHRSERLALEAADHLRAAGQYEAALSTLSDVEGGQALLLRAHLWRLQGDAAAALSALEGREDPAALALAARAHFDAGQPDLARGRLTQLDAAGARDDATACMAAEVEVLLAMAAGGDVQAPLARLRARSEATGDARWRARAFSLHARWAGARGAWTEAVGELRQSVALASAASEAHEAATFTVNLGLAELEHGELGPAVTTLRLGAERLSWLGREAELSRVLFNLGNAALAMGDDVLAEASLQRAQARLADSTDVQAMAWTEVSRAELDMRRGALGPAADRLAQALRALPLGQGYARGLVAARLGFAAACADRLEQAEDALSQARQQRDAHPSLALEVSVATARTRLSAADAGGAEQAVAEALSVLEQGASFEQAMRVWLLAAETARARGLDGLVQARLARARGWLDRALAGLTPAQRERMRRVEGYARALAASPVVDGSASAGDHGRWRTLVAASGRLLGQDRPRQVARAAVELALELVSAERAWLIEGRLSEEPRVWAAQAPGAGAVYSRSVVDRVLSEGRPLVTTDALDDERLRGAGSVHQLQLRSVVALPVRWGERGAVLYVDDRMRPSAFGGQDEALLADLARLTGVGLQTAGMLRKEQRAARQLKRDQRALNRRLELQRAELSSVRQEAQGGVTLVGRSRAAQRMLNLATRVAASDAPVLLVGESGTGKELLARRIHGLSDRASGPFVAESCAALPETLLESALFGHVRGAFTGADRARVGLLEAADGGTLLLDEVAEMSPALQAKLLRTLQEGEVRPLGGEHSKRVDVRLVTATHRDLPQLVASGEFRQDLFYRIAVVTLPLPPLRERVEDVVGLVAHFLEKHGRAPLPQVSPAVLQHWEAQPWPGNIRQLENEVRRALVFADESVELQHVLRETQDVEPAPSSLDLKAQVDALQSRLVRRALGQTAGNQTRAAELLGISRFGLQKMMKRLGLV